MLEGAHAGRSAAKRTDGDRGGATPRAAGGAHARPTGSRAHRFSRCASRSDRASRARRRGRAVLELRPIVKAGVDLGSPLLGVGILVFDGDEQADGTNARVRVALSGRGRSPPLGSRPRHRLCSRRSPLLLLPSGQVASQGQLRSRSCSCPSRGVRKRIGRPLAPDFRATR